MIDRIRTEHYVECAVALDTFDLIAKRVRTLLSHGRRLSMTERLTYTGHAPDLYAGLSVDEAVRDGGFDQWVKNDGCGFYVALRPGIRGFGFAAYTIDGNATESEVWERYHAAKAESEDFFERRRDLTVVELSGGREQDGVGRDDHIVIRAWNSDGVCDERVIAFEAAS